MGLMSEAHRHNLNRNRIKLMKNIQCLPSIFEFLRQDYTLTADMQEEIQAERIHDRQVVKLIDVLSRRSDRAFDRFVNALVHTHQDELAVLLDPKTAPHLIKTRDDNLQADSTLQGVAMSRSDAPQHTFIPTNSMLGTNNQTPVLPVVYIPVNTVTPTFTLPAVMGTAVPTSAVMQPVIPVQLISHSTDTRPISEQDFHNEVVGSGVALMDINIQPTADVAQLKNTQRIYSIDHRPRGRAVIISNHYFLKENLEVRDGAEFDEVNVHSLFTKLDFSVQLYTNTSASEMKTLLENESRSDSHRTADAFVLVLLTHGSQGSIFGVDGEKVCIDDITTLFDGNHCPHLQNKPKLFFIQACQGKKKSSRYPGHGPSNVQPSQYQSDGPTNVQPSDASPSSESGSEAEYIRQRLADLSVEDTPGFVPPLPSVTSQAHEKADMLIAYATVKGYEAWRHCELGSWFVRALVYVFQRRAHRQHIVDMLTEVNYLVSRLETVGTQVPYRQVAEKTDSLLKQLYFLPGYPAV